MGNPAELRLALVCYGGVSLAVYMHGVTKELQSLIRAARAYDKASLENPDNPFRAGKPPYGTEAAYFDALKDLARKGRRLSVSIDIIGGTSAGGINGIALSKGLATGASQEPLKRVWIDEGDIRALLRAPAWGLPVQALIAASCQVFRLASAKTPLRGEKMSQLILDALGKMDDRTHEDSLVPPGGSLELYVPATDLDGFDVLVPSGAGGASNQDRQNAQVFEFCFAKEQFGKSHTADLAFAARASASFPGAFAPVSQESFKTETGKDLDFHTDVFHYQSPVLKEPARREKVSFVDGGVLDNAPFDIVISAISRRRADSEVYRRLVYIEPDPGHNLYAAAVDTAPSRRRWLGDLLAVNKVKGSHPFLRDLLDLRDLNKWIGEVSAITERQKAYVVEAIAIARTSSNGVWEPPADVPINYGTRATTTLLDSTADAGIQTLSDNMHVWVKDALYPSFSTYQRLKFDAAIRQLADQLAEKFGFANTSAQADFIDAATAAWARQQEFWSSEPDDTVGKPPGDVLGELLRPIDVPYRDRRLVFILAGIAELYKPQKDDHGDPRQGPPRPQLDLLKGDAWDLLVDLRGAAKDVVDNLEPATVDFLKLEAPSGAARQDDPLLANPADFAVTYKAEFQTLFDTYSTKLKDRIGDGSDKLWKAFTTHTNGWLDDDKQALLSRYLGFPLWDAMIFPTLTLTRVPQLTQIGVQQFSPLMATKLDPLEEKPKRRWPLFWKKTEPGPTTKLKGIPVSHFAGFFSAKSRENDYLWGRLDAAELILRLLQDVGASMILPKVRTPQDAPVPHLVTALQGILDSETKPVRDSDTKLHRIPELLADVQRQVDELKAKENPVVEPKLETPDLSGLAVAD